MKLFKIITLFLTGSLAVAQIPNGYYNSATGTGYTLKTQLHNIIKNHDSQSYGALWSLYNHSSYKDTYYENDNTLLDIYSEKPNGPDSYSFNIGSGDQCGNYGGEGDCYNREHVIPQSVFNEASPMVTDAHHIMPVDGYVNGRRSSYPFGVVNSATWTSTNGSKLGSNKNSGYSAGYSGTVFEPIDEFKGDIARIYFYFATRYQDKVANYSYAMFNGTSNQVFTDTFLSILLTWHYQDPVSQREININNRIYNFQGNRNPFIDNPEYVQMIWGAPLSTNDYWQSQVTVYPNPVFDQVVNISTPYEINEISVYNVSGQEVQKFRTSINQNGSLQLNNLPKGFYILKMNVEDNLVTKKIIIN